MREISEREVLERFEFDNPWWSGAEGIDPEYREMPERAYLQQFKELVCEHDLKRAVILMGPRRVGKTVLVYQTIQHLLDSGAPATSIFYMSLETPIYTGLALEKLIKLYMDKFGFDKTNRLYIFFDEIQYLNEWEVHLKSLVDSYRQFKFTATGSAAAALRLKSRESGAGRFTEFLLPPLTFAEYLQFRHVESELIRKSESGFYASTDIHRLNEEFIRYLNFGGYPEAVFSRRIQADSSRYIKSDIIDKVLLRDLPSLYGINDIQELNRLFTTVAYNTGDEVSLEGLSKSSGVAKNTIKRYLEYLEAAFLIKIVHRVDRNAKRFQRATTFKVYLANPSMRAALFGPVKSSDESMGNLTETAIFSQWFHDITFVENNYYARWNDGEVDIVACDPRTQKAIWTVEVKWSDRFFTSPHELRSLISFHHANTTVMAAVVTTITVAGKKAFDGVKLEFIPSSVYCYAVGKNAVTRISTQYQQMVAAQAADAVQ